MRALARGGAEEWVGRGFFLRGFDQKRELPFLPNNSEFVVTGIQKVI